MASPIVLGITIRADGSAQVRRELGGVRDGLNGAGNAAAGANRQFADMARETLGLGSALKGLAAGLSAVALYQYGKEVVNVADNMKLLDGRIKVAAANQSDYIQSSRELLDVSLSTHTQFDANATMFARINKSMEAMGGTSRNTTAFIETMDESLRLSGASAAETASVIRQTSQAMASGVVRGDEFNSIMENGSRMAYALAAGLKVDIGELRKMAEEGQLTSGKVIRAIMSQAAVIDAEYKKLPLTVGAAFENVKTQWGQYVLAADAGSGATAGLAEQVNILADNLAPLIDAIVTLGKVVVTVFAGQMLISLGQYTAAKYAAIAVERAHAAALTMDLERTVALTAARLAATQAEIAATQATLAGNLSMGARMGLTNQLNILLAAQTAQTEALAAATAAQTAATVTFAGSLKMLLNPINLVNIGLAGLVGWEIGTWLRSFQTVRIVATATLGAILQGIENVTYGWNVMRAVMSGNPGALDGLKAAHLAEKKAIDDNIVSGIAYELSSKKAVAAADEQSKALSGLANEKAQLTDAEKKALKDAESAAKKAATEERNRRESILATIETLQFELAVNRLSDKEKELQTALRQNLAKAVGAERTQIEALVKQIHAEADARERQQAMWDELIKNANALDELKDSAADAQRLASLAQELKLQGLTNDAIGQRIDLEKEKAAAIAANPDLDPAQVSAYVEARSTAEATLQKLTSDGANKSADQLDAAYKRALENIQDSFADMFESLLSGDALASFEDFFDSVGKSLRKAISQNLALGIQNALSGNGGGGAGLVFGAGLIASLFTRKTPAARELSAAENYNGAVAGTGAMAIADSFGRDRGFQFQSQTALQFNKSLQYLSDTIMNAGGSIVDWIGSLGTKMASTSVVQSVAAFFKPVTSMIGQATSFISNIYNSLTSLVTKGVAAISSAVGLTSAGSGAANAASTGVNAGVSAMQNVAGALAIIKFGFDLFQTWGSDNLTTHKKITNSLYAASDALLAGAAIYANWMAAAAAAVLNIGGVISDVFENGFNSENFGRLLFGPLAGLFMKQRTPNAWMNTYSPGGGDYQFDPNAGTYTATGNKSAYVGEATPFGMTVISTHELSLTTEEMINAFGALLKTVKTVDTNLYNTINRLDEKFGETGRTMDFYNRLLSDGNPGRTSVSTRQDTSELNTGGMLLERYSWIVNRLADSGSVVGQALNAWFDVITGKFISASQDNSIMVVGIIDSLAANLEDFMQFPLQLVDLIGQSVKSVNQGGTPESVMDEIMGVLNTFNLVKQGFAQMNLDVDSNRIAAFLARVNAIGYGVQEAGLNLLAYGIALQKINGTIAASGDALMDTVERKFNDLKRQGLNNTQLNAYFGSFGLFANLFAEARVAFNEGDLDNAAGQIHRLSQASVETAKNVIDHAIASEKLTHISREAAIATLVKSGKIEEATVAEAEYGVSVQKATQDILSAMGFIQQLGYVTGRSLGMMGVSASTWQAAAKNVVNVFGDLEKAMQTFDSIARTFLSSDEYASYNLATVNRGLANLRAANPELAGITEAGVTEALKGGNAGIAGFIERLAQGNGELAKATLEYVQLLGQRLALEKELEDQLGQTSRAFSDFVKNLHAVRSSIAANINSLGGSASINNVAFQQGVIDRLYAQLANTTDRAEQVSIIGEINQAVMDRYNAELDMLGRVDDTVKQIRSYLDNLKLSDKSPLTNAQKLAEAQAQYRTQLAMANAGDKDALAGITNAADAYLQQARIYFASSENYTAIFDGVTAALEALAVPPGMDEATYKAETLRLQDTAISELQSLDKTLLDIYAAEQTANAVRHAELVSALASGAQALLIETAMNDATMALGRALTDFESQWIRDQFSSGRDKTAIYAEAGQYIQQQKLHGSHATGLDYVPFDGYRAELHKGERVLTAAQARRQDGENDQALIAELRALRAEVAQLRADQRTHTEAIVVNNRQAASESADKIVNSNADATRTANWQSRNRVTIK